MPLPRMRISTTVDGELSAEARRMTDAESDAVLIDQALGALLAPPRRSEVDRTYAAYDEHPIDEPDEWGDLASFRAAAAST